MSLYYCWSVVQTPGVRTTGQTPIHVASREGGNWAFAATLLKFNVNLDRMTVKTDTLQIAVEGDTTCRGNYGEARAESLSLVGACPYSH